MISEYQAKRNRVLLHLGGKCSVCGTTKDLEIDHRDWLSKTMDVSANLERKWLDLLPELEKCQCLCKEHHKQKSKADNLEWCATQPAKFKHGTVYSWMKMKCKCEACEKAKRAWHDARNQKRREEGGTVRGSYDMTKPTEHGTRRMYWSGCRCEACRRSNAQAERERRNRKRLK